MKAQQFGEHLEKLQEKELEAAFKNYAAQAVAASGIEIDNIEEIRPMLRAAFDKGIGARRLGQLLAQTKAK